MQNTLQQIKASLRLMMNGAVSSSMRKKGMDYRLNMGVDIPRLRQFAKKYTPDPVLASALWQEKTRELKILATLLYPAEEFLQADEWIKNVNNPELAEQLSMNLFSRMPGAKTTALRWLKEENVYQKLTAYHTLTRLMMQGEAFPAEESRGLLEIALADFDSDSLFLRNAVLNTLFRLIEQDQEQKTSLLAALSERNDLLELLT